MSTSTTHQQSLVDVGSETRPSMLERGEELVLVYNRFAQLRIYLEQNGIKFPRVTVNTKFLNYLQLGWLKYVTQNPSPYYVTHPSSVADYDDDYQGDAFQNNSEDPLICAMMLLARAITQPFSNPT
ncbi:hypothetical protein Tco_1239628, partial [Tanacetum coccineum]